MTTVAHKVLDVLKGRPNAEMTLRVTPFNTRQETLDHLEALIDGIETAEYFDFGELHLEQHAPHQYVLPSISADEYTAWAMGMVPLPASTVWYEFTIGGVRNMILCVYTDNERHGPMWSAVRMYWMRGENFNVDGIWCSGKLSDATDPEKFMLTLHGNMKARKTLDRKTIDQDYMSSVPIVIYLTLMIGSRTTEIRGEPAPHKLNKQRAKKGLDPLPAHRVVRIVPERYLRERLAEAGLSRRPPRMHWRSSHLRSVSHQTPKAKQMPNGDWKILIPRFLVAKAANAEVSHEYRVGHKETK